MTERLISALLLLVSCLLAFIWLKKYQAEKALREARAEFDNIINNANPICVTNPAYEIIMANRAYVDTFGQVEKDGAKVKCFESRRGDCCHTGACPLKEILDQGKAELVSETVKYQNGGSRHFVVTCKALKNMEGKVVGLMESFHDVTEIKQLETEREKSKHLEALGVVAGGIAHDFNNLLQVIVGNISLARVITSPHDELTPLLKAVETASWQAKELTQKILTFSKGGSPLLRQTDLAEVLKRALTEALTQKNVSVHCDIAPDLYRVDGDENHLQQAIKNIVRNAEEAMPDGGTLSVTASNRDFSEVKKHLVDQATPVAKYVHIALRDTGKGIPAECLTKIFDPYFSGKGKGCIKGTGLGLSTAYSIVKKHQGFIRVESVLGAGTTFHLYFPACAGCVGHDEKKTAGLPRQSTHSLLLMDDEELVREAAASMFSFLKWRLEVAQNGEEALTLYQRALTAGCPFDLVILDLTIVGGMGGQETLSRLQQIDPAVKAIVSSGYTEDPVMSDFLGHGFCAAIAKPYSLDKVQALLQRLTSTL